MEKKECIATSYTICRPAFPLPIQNQTWITIQNRVDQSHVVMRNFWAPIHFHTLTPHLVFVVCVLCRNLTMTYFSETIFTCNHLQCLIFLILLLTQFPASKSSSRSLWAKLQLSIFFEFFEKLVIIYRPLVFFMRWSSWNQRASDATV